MLETILGTKSPCQIGMIVKDIEESKRKVAAFYGIDVPPTVGGGDFEITKCQYMGEPAPDANCKMAFFEMGNIQLELIEPNEEPSTWRNFLNEHGEGMHHIAFQVRDSARQVANAEAAGLKLVQHGLYGDASGEYNYLDAPELKCIVELLESYKK